MDRSKIAIVIPAFNEANTIQRVVLAASAYGTAIVVDDCSSDGTAELAYDAGAVVVKHLLNTGYDGALNSGFAEAISTGYTCVITLDADGQHDPEMIGNFVSNFSTDMDLVLGYRSRLPRFGEKLFAMYTNTRFGIRDPLCGMKAYSRDVYESLGHFDSYGSVGTELALYAVRNNYSFTQLGLSIRDRVDQPRFGGIVSANYKIIRAMIIAMLPEKISHFIWK